MKTTLTLDEIKHIKKETMQMTGKELIEFIQENHAEDLLVCVQYRDGGGFYSGADDAAPLMGHVTKQVDANNYDDYDITYVTQDVNAIIL